jgi:hypothetical protein
MSEEIKQLWLAIVAAGISGGAIGSLLTIFINHRLTIGRDRMVKLEGEIRVEKSQFIPMLNQIISDANRDQPLLAWRHHKGNLEKSVWRFGTFLKGKRKATFDVAWQKCSEIKDEDLLDKGQNWFADNRVSEMKIAQKFITVKLQALLDCVEKA